MAVIDGRALARTRNTQTAARVDAMRERGIQPRLAVILVGHNAASLTYVRQKQKAAGRIGIDVDVWHYAESVDAATLRTQIGTLNADASVHGIIIQLPLPSHIDAAALLGDVTPEKDVDGLGPANRAALMAGAPGLRPCTPQACVHILEQIGQTFSGATATVIGRSLLVGRPLAQMLLARDMTVTIAHSQTRDLAAACRPADVVVSATGQAHLVRGDWIKAGANVIDVGISRDTAGRLMGDLAFDEVVAHAHAITPVPGGVGPLTVAFLLHNVVEAADAQT